MNITLAFTLGVLSVFFVAVVVILAWGIVGVIKLNKKLIQIEQRFESNLNSLWSENTKTRDYLDRSIADVHMQTDRRFDDLDRTLVEVTKHCESYTDSRVDKMVSRGRTLLKDDIN